MEKYPKIFSCMLFLLFSVLLAYPNNLFAELYINYIFIIICGFLVFTFESKKKKNYIISFFLIIFLIVISGNVNSLFVINNVDFKNYLSSTLRFFSYLVLVYILFNSTNSKKDFKFWISSFIFGYLLSLIIICLDSMRVPWIEVVFKIISFESQETLDIYFRAYGAYLSPISAGVFISNTSILLIISLIYLNFRVKPKLTLILILVLSIVCLFMTASRTGIISLFLTVIIIILKSKNRINILISTLILGVIVYYSGFVDNYIENILLRFSRESEGGRSALEGSGRLDTYANSLRLYFNERSFFYGVGPSEYIKGDGVYSFAHNGFLSAVLIYGFIGLSLFVKLLIDSIRLFKNNAFTYSLLFFYTLINFIAFISSDGPATHFWMINFICFLYFIFYSKKYFIIPKN